MAANDQGGIRTVSFRRYAAHPISTVPEHTQGTGILSLDGDVSFFYFKNAAFCFVETIAYNYNVMSVEYSRAHYRKDRIRSSVEFRRS